METKSFSQPLLLPDSFGSSEELALSRLIRYELSRLRCHGHSLLLSCYLCRIKWKENFSCSPCGHSLQDMTNLLLDCPTSEPLRRAIFGTTSSIFDLWSRPCGVARLLGLREVPPRPIPHKGPGSTTTTTRRPLRCLLVEVLDSINEYLNLCALCKIVLYIMLIQHTPYNKDVSVPYWMDVKR